MENYQTYIENISTKKRSTDRFSYFALQHLSQNNAFDFDFQIDLGKVLKKSYKKTILGITPQENNRNIIENILVFNNMSLFENKNEAEILAIKNRIINESEFVKRFDKIDVVNFEQFAPHFNTENNKIGLLSTKNNKFKHQLYRPIAPTAFLSTHELPKVILLEHLEKGGSSLIINAFINANSEVIFNKEIIEEIRATLAFNKTLYKVFFDEKLKVKDWKKDIESDLNHLKEAIKLLKSKEVPFSEKRSNENLLKNKQAELKSLNYALYVKRVNERKEKLNVVLEKIIF